MNLALHPTCHIMQFTRPDKTQVSASSHDGSLKLSPTFEGPVNNTMPQAFKLYKINMEIYKISNN